MKNTNIEEDDGYRETDIFIAFILFLVLCGLIIAAIVYYIAPLLGGLLF